MRRGERPSALETFHAGYNPRSLRRTRGSWLGFVRDRGGLDDAGREALAAPKARTRAARDAPLEELSRQPAQPADLRVAALEALAGRRKQLHPESFALLTEHLSERTEPTADT